MLRRPQLNYRSAGLDGKRQRLEKSSRQRASFDNPRRNRAEGIGLKLPKAPIDFAPQLLLRAEPFPPLTLGLLLLQGGGPSEQRRWQPERRMCQPLLFRLGRVVSL